MQLALMIIADIVILAILGIVVYKSVQNTTKSKVESLEKEAEEVLKRAERDAEAKKKEAILEAKEELHRLRNDFDKESRDRRNEIQRLERRVIQREEALDKKSELLESKEQTINEKMLELDQVEAKVQELYNERRAELERVAALSGEEAREILLDEIRKEITHDAALMIKDIESRAKEEADKKSREIITTAIQRCAADHVSETTVHVVALPNDEMKGRIIGREGRNIRTLETLTGVDLIIDDTPEAVILSSFDPIRREVARMALEKLIVDGIIHPARIEEMVERATKD
ncbi:MAG: Rnase Y domain-containing protein, partial [Clostridium butyricum]